MKTETFVDTVKKHFDFLETEYGFKVILASSSQVRAQTDGVVKYASNTRLILIDSEMGQVAVRFVRVQDDERYYLDPVCIHEYLNTSEPERRILLSRAMKDKDAANAIFHRKFLLLLPEWRSSEQDVSDDLERRLKNYAKWLKENADLCLSEDFLRWLEFYEYKINRLTADELRGGGKEVVRAVVKDEDGTLRTIERPVFQRERDHLERMRKEILGR